MVKQKRNSIKEGLLFNSDGINNSTLQAKSVMYTAYSTVEQLLDQLTTLDTKRKAIVALCLILPAPLLGITASLNPPSIGDIQIGKAIWLLMKVWLIAMPVLWLLYVDKGKLSWSATTSKGVIAGLLWSIPVSIAILGIYWIAKDALIDPEAKQKIDDLGITSPAQFLLFAIVMSLGNSLMEEYVWRWFVFSKFKLLVGVYPAILLSAVFFTLHHVVILWNFGSLQLVVVGALGLCVGGVIWGWLYQKYNSIWPGWICHVAADTVIMWITWTIITGN